MFDAYNNICKRMEGRTSISFGELEDIVYEECEGLEYTQTMTVLEAVLSWVNGGCV